MGLFKDIKGFINNQISIGLKDTKVEIRNNNGILEFKNKDNDFKPFTTLSNWKENQLYTQNIDIVLYNNKIYRCITTHTSSTSFNPLYWTLLNDLSASAIQPWNSNTDYLQYNIVLFGNNLYSALADHNSGVSFDTTKWQKLGTSNGGGLQRIDYLSNDSNRTVNQTDFVSPNHTVDTQALLVLVDGVIVIKNSDYLDIDETHIKFLYDIEPTQSVSIILIDIASLMGNLIDDSNVANDTTWSSSKLDVKFNDIQTVLDQLTYVAPQITSFTNSVNTVENGTIINAVNFYWNVNKDIVSQSIDNGIGAISDVTQRAYSLTGQSISTDKTWSLTINDGKTSKTATTSVLFRNKSYRGVNSKDTLSNSDVITLPSQFSSSKAFTQTFACNNNYIYFAYPKSLGSATIKVNGLLNTAFIESSITLTNSQGYTTDYYLYRSPYLLDGNIVVEVS